MSENLSIKRVMFVCLGNICRSPTAHAIFRHKALQARLNVEIASSGTAAYHVGSPPDKRSVKAGNKRGYDFNGLYAQKVSLADFDFYDLILPMDNANLSDLMSICPPEHKGKVKLFLDFAENFPEQQEVPDPYYGGAAGFEFVIDLIEDASDGLVNIIKKGL